MAHPVELVGEMAEEQKTEAHAVGGVLTFQKPIRWIEFFNVDKVNTGVFTVNGIPITVPPDTPYKSGVGGIAGNTVTVTGSTSYIVTRYV